MDPNVAEAEKETCAERGGDRHAGGGGGGDPPAYGVPAPRPRVLRPLRLRHSHHSARHQDRHGGRQKEKSSLILQKNYTLFYKRECTAKSMEGHVKYVIRKLFYRATIAWLKIQSY